MSHCTPEYNRPPEGEEPDKPFPLFADLDNPVFDGPSPSRRRSAKEKPCEDAPMLPDPPETSVLPCSPAPAPKGRVRRAKKGQKHSTDLLKAYCRRLLEL